MKKAIIVLTALVAVTCVSLADNNKLTQNEIAVMMAYSEGVDLLVNKYRDAGQVKLSELRPQARDIAVAILSRTIDYDPVSEKTLAATERMTTSIVELVSSLLKEQGVAVVDDSLQAQPTTSTSSVDN